MNNDDMLAILFGIAVLGIAVLMEIFLRRMEKAWLEQLHQHYLKVYDEKFSFDPVEVSESKEF